MNKVLSASIAAVVLASAALVAVAADNEAKSVNAVGVVKYTIPAHGQLVCISLPLNPLDDAVWYWPNTSLAEQLPRGSMVYFWGGAQKGWVSSVKQKSGWSDAANLLTDDYAILPGQAFFVQGPSNKEEDQEISLLGELPVDGTMSYALTGNGNLDMRSISMYPVTTTFVDSPLNDLPRGTLAYRWDGSKWITATRQKSAWQGEWINETLPIGEGIFIEMNGETREIEEERPFEWEQ